MAKSINTNANTNATTAAAIKLLRNPVGSTTAAAPKAKAKVKPTVTAAPVAPEPFTASIDVDGDISALFAKWGIKVPTTARIVISYIAAFIVGGVIGHVGGTLLAYTLAGAATFGASALVSFLIMVLGIVLTLAAAWKFGGKAGDFVMSGDIDVCYEYASTKAKAGAAYVGDKASSATGWVKGFFSRNNAGVTKPYVA